MTGASQFPIDFTLPDNSVDGRGHFANKYGAREPIDPNNLPTQLFWNQYPEKNLTDVFRIIGALLVISGRFKDLLERFNLGETRFHKVALYKYGGEVLDEDADLYVVLFEETRGIGVPERMSWPSRISKHWFLRDMKVEDILVRSPEMGDLDLSVDHNLQGAVYVSDSLAKAMKSERIRRPRMVPCVEVE